MAGVLLTAVEGASDNELGHVDLNYIRKTYGYPHMVGHRSSLASGMFEACKREQAIKFHFCHALESVESFSPKPTFRIKPRDGESYTVKADVLLASDGIKSVVRTQMLKELDVDAQIIDTNSAAYRIMLNRKDMENDPELLELIEGDSVTRWIGEKRHIIAYPVSSKTIYNISTAQPDTNFAAAPSVTYTTKGDKSVMLDVFSDFCPKVQRLLNLVPEGEVCEWKLRVHSPLPTWIHGSMALVGDACHPTLPHLAQGAAQAIEDAAVLAAVLERCPDQDPQNINKSLRVYEKIRKERAETLVELAAASGRALHLGESAAKAERDKQFAALKEKKGTVPDKWADADVQRQIYGFDCTQVAEDSFDELFASL
jgi:salicylate hydroxylase